MRRLSVRRAVGLGLTGLLGLASVGCGVPAPLPNSAAPLDLALLREIQRDPTRTVAQRRELLRDLLDLPDDDAGNRIATFLLNVNIP